MFRKTLLLLSLLSAPSLLAAAPNIGDIENQIQRPREVEQGMDNTLPTLPQEQTPAIMETLGGKTVAIKGFKLTGASHIKEDSLLRLLKPYEDKSYTLAELKTIAHLITQTYQAQGYFVARAYIPKQKIQEGVLEIAIIEGTYGEFKLDNSSLVTDININKRLNQVKANDDVIFMGSLERAMLLINDTPGAKVTGVNVMPGETAGTSDFVFKTEATNPYSAYIVGDNYGSKYTGRNRLNVGVSRYSPFGYGHRFSFNGLLSSTGDLKNGALTYELPLGSNGLTGAFSIAKTTYALAEDYEALDALGESTNFDAELSYPLIRSRQKNLTLTVGYSYRKMEEEINATSTLTKKETHLATLEALYTQQHSLFNKFNSNNTASLMLTHGNLDIKDAESQAIDEAGAKTNGSYTKLSGSLENHTAFNPTYSLVTSFRFQKALGNKNLDGSEDFSLGGAYGVRAFPYGEESAENGYILGTELFYTLPPVQALQHKISLFVDTGYAKMQNPISDTESRQLSDIGLGYQASYKTFHLKAQLAHVIGGENVTSESEYETKALLQLGWVY
jgi:hemolysin activation/secretion protein